MTMLDLLRTFVAIPLGVLDLAWCWLTRDEAESELAAIRQDLIDLAEGL